MQIAHITDAAEITSALIEAADQRKIDYSSRFGHVIIERLIDTSSLALIQKNEEQEIVAFLCFDTRPSIIGDMQLSEIEWQSSLSELLPKEHLNWDSTAWVKYFFVKSPSDDMKYAEIGFHQFFQTFSCYKRLLAFAPKTQVYAPLDSVFTRLATSDEKLLGSFDLFSCSSRIFLSTMSLRRARVEDFDELAPIVDQESTRLTDMFGTFFLAEVIEAQNQNNKAWVCQVNGRIVGFISATTEVGAEALEDCFDLREYDSFHKTPLETEKPKEEDDETKESIPQFDLWRAMCDHMYAFIEKEELKETLITLLKVLDPLNEVSALAFVASQLEEIAEIDQDRFATILSSMVDECGRDQVVEHLQTLTGAPEFQHETEQGELVASKEPDQEEEEEEEEDFINERKERPVDISNVLCISIFCVERDIDMGAQECLSTIFAAFPTRDYLLLSLPHEIQHAVPLLDPYFVSVPAKSGRAFAHTLKVVHRSSIVSHIQVRPYTAADTSPFLHGVPKTKSIRKRIQTYLIRQKQSVIPDKQFLEEHSFLIHADDQPIGIVQLSQICEQETNNLMRDYDIERLPGCRFPPLLLYKLQTFLIYPTFKPNRREILLQVYRQLPEEAAGLVYMIEDQINLPDVVVDLFAGPVPGRNVPLRKAEQPINSSALYVVTKPYLANYPFLNRLHNRIVVIGASETGLATLAELLEPSRLDCRFENLTLISPGGLPDGIDTSLSEPQFLPWTLRLDTLEMQHLALDVRTTIVDGTVETINTQQNLITLQNGTVVPYDIVILTPGLQSQTLQKGIEYDRDGDAPVHGVYRLSTENDVLNVLTYLSDQGEPPIAVYGVGLGALQIISGLLEIGVDGDNIIWVTPHRDQTKNWCSDTEISKAALDELDSLGVVLVENLKLRQVVSSKSGRVQGIILEEDPNAPPPPELDNVLLFGRQANSRVLRCHVLLCCDDYDIDRAIFKIASVNPFVYNGALIVNDQFQTNDLRVFGAGTCAQVSRRYSQVHGQELAFRNCNSSEVGCRVATSVRNSLGFSSGSLTALAPYTKPISQVAFLPGQKFYFESRLPKAPPVEHVLSSSVDGRLTRIGLDIKGCIVSIQYYGAEFAAFREFATLVGLPVSYLNSLSKRMELGQVEDISQFLSESWAAALYHDRFPADVITPTSDQLQSLELFSRIRNFVSVQHEKGQPLEKEELDHLLSSESRESASYQLIQRSLLTFLHQADNHLPSYLYKEMINLPL